MSDPDAIRKSLSGSESLELKRELVLVHDTYGK